MEEKNSTEIGFGKEQNKIKNNYLKIYKIVFKFMLPILLIISSFFISKQILNSYYLNNISIFPDKDKDINQIQKDKLISDFENQMKQNIDDNNIQIEIIQGDLYTKGDFIYSKNNLIYYKGFISPQNLVIQKTIPLNNIDYFNKQDYEIKNLEIFIENMIFNKKNEIKIKSEKNKQLFLNETINKTFNLSCLFENRLTEKMCNYYLSNFLKYFFVYDISSDIQGLKQINKIISGGDKQKQFCENIKKYIIYSRDNKSDLKEIISDCGEKENEYNKIINFIEIQKELEENYISDKIYPYKDLNTYKLLSYQQILYEDISLNKIDYIKLNNYLSFLKILLKENHLEQIYKDEIYWFNNYFLLNKLEKVNKQDLSKITKDIYIINKGDPVFGLIGLSDQIKNQDLKNYLNKEENTHNSNPDLSGSDTSGNRLIDTLAKSLENISYFSITKKDIIGDERIDLEGYFSIKDKLIKTEIILKKEQNSLIVNSLNLENYDTLTKVVSNLIKTNGGGINKIYQYISDNIDTYGKEDETKTITSIGICDILGSKIDKREIIECGNNKILIDRLGINYNFILSNNKITNVEISNKEINNNINDYLKGLSKETNILEIIQYIINYKIEKDVTNLGNQNIVISTEIFKKYLGIDPLAVVESKGSIFIDFKIKEIGFVGEFDMKTNTIKALYFKDIISDGKPLDIKNFSLSLDDKNKTIINQFVIDPINYIKTIDSFGYINYQNRFGEK